MDLRANTAVDVLIGPFVDSTDGNTTEDGLTISQADVKLSKNGQTLAQKSDVTACAFDDDGYYNCELDATDTNTEGLLVVIVHESGALPVRHEYNILSEAAWDSIYTAKDTGFMDVNVKAVSEDTTAADNLESACDNYSVTRGLTGTAVPAVAADGAGGLPISDAGGLDLDTQYAVLVTGIAAETNNDTLIEQLQTIVATVENLRPAHTGQPIGKVFYVDPVNGATTGSGATGGITDPVLTIQDCHDALVTDSNHDTIILLAGAAAGITTHTVAATTTISKRYTFIRGPGRDFLVTRTGNGDTLAVTADGVELSGFQLETAGTGAGNGIQATDADFLRVQDCWINDTQGDGINILRGENCQIRHNVFTDTGQGGAGEGVHISGTAGSSNRNHIVENTFHQCAGDGVLIEQGTTNQSLIRHNIFEGNAGYGINIGASSTDAFVTENRYGGNTSGEVNDGGTDTIRTADQSTPIDGSLLTTLADGVVHGGSTAQLILQKIYAYNPSGIGAQFIGGPNSDGLNLGANDMSALSASGFGLRVSDGIALDAGTAEIYSRLAAIILDTGTDIPALIATAQTDLDIITGADGVNLLSATQASIDAIEADTNELQTDWADAGRLDAILDSVLAMLDDARAEPAQGAPTVNPDAMTKIDYLYKAWRNKKTQTATTVSIFADDASTVDHKSTISDDGTTATVGEIATGP